MKFSAGRIAVILLSPVIAAVAVAVLLMAVAIVSSKTATMIDIPHLVSFAPSVRPGSALSLYIDPSWTALAVVTGIVATPIVALALFLPD